MHLNDRLMLAAILFVQMITLAMLLLSMAR
jgi:hypothetical protein